MTTPATPRPWIHYRNPLPTGVLNEIQKEVGVRGRPPIVNWMGFDDSNRPEVEHAANAALIVRAVNAHDALLAALTEALDLLDSMGDRPAFPEHRALLRDLSPGEEGQ